MAARKHAREDEADFAAAAGPPSPPPPARRRPATRGAVAAEAYERRLKLTDIIGYVALNGYAREARVCAGLNRETWRCVPAGLSAADADRVRAGHPLWQAIIDLRGISGWTRLTRAAYDGKIIRLRSLCDWRAGIEVRDSNDRTALISASIYGRIHCARELIARGADVNAEDTFGFTSLMIVSLGGHIDTVRLLLAAGADKRRVSSVGGDGHTAHAMAQGRNAAAIRALLDAAP